MNSARKTILLSLVLAGTLVLLLWWRPGETRRGPARAALVVYCAAGLKPPAAAIARQYEQQFGVPVQLQYGGSGTLLSNLRVSGRGDLFLAADESYLELARSNQLVTETLPIGRMQMVVAVRHGNPKRLRAFADLLRPDMAVSLANPDTAAVGKILRDLLRRTGDWAALERHAKVFKPTVSDVANDVELGAVDAGIVWDATVALYPDLEAVSFPPIDRGEERVAVGVLRCSRQPGAALAFARFLTAPEQGLREFARAGYRVGESGRARIHSP